MKIHSAALALPILLSFPTVAAQAAPIKAAYFYGYQDPGHLDSLASAGFNRALVKNINDSLTTRPRAELRQLRDRGARVGIDVVPSWALQATSRLTTLPTTRRYTWGTYATVDSLVGCPLDSLFWSSTFYDRGREVLAAFPSIRRLHVDLEIYTGSRTHYNAGPCICSACVNEYAAYCATQPVQGRLGREAWQQGRLTAILGALLARYAALSPGIEISFFDLDLDNFVHRATARALAGSAIATANFTERTYTKGAEAVPLARQALDNLGLRAPLIGGLSLRRFLPADLHRAAQSMLEAADGCFIFTTYSLWQQPSRLTGPYVLSAPQTEYWDALRGAFALPELVPSRISIVPQTAQAGSTVEFEFTIYNRGPLMARPTRWVLSSGDLSLAAGDVSIAARDSAVIAVTLSANLGVGRHIVRVTVDSLTQVTELDETNNAEFSALVIEPAPQPVRVRFPATSVQDNFNRSSGPLGSLWIGDIGGAVISSKRFKPTTSGYVAAVWNGPLLGGDQEAYAMLYDVSSSGPRQGLLLKVQGPTVASGALEVVYNGVLRRVTVSTYTPGRGWEPRGFFPIKLSDDDVLGARAFENGDVDVFRNGSLLGTCSVAGWPYAHGGGRIGLTLENSSGTRFDDFGGGSLGGSQPSGPPNRTPVAAASASTTSGLAPLTVRFSSAGSVDPDGDPLAYGWSFGDGALSSDASPSHAYGAGTFRAILTVSDGRGGMDRDTVLVTGLSTSFPSTAVQDAFDRAAGPLGPSWSGAVSAATVSSGRLKPTAATYVAAVWNGSSPGANQEAYVMFVDVTRAVARQGLLLKVQGQAVESGAIEVRYDYVQKKIFVATYTPGSGWRERGYVPGKISDDDVLGARAYANGDVEVYRNGLSIGTVSVAGWPFATRGGRIGVTLENALSTRLDDFGGGSLPEILARPEEGMIGRPGDPSTEAMPPISVELVGGVPNPFANDVHIRFGLPTESDAVLEIFDIQGREMTTLVRGRLRAGWHSIRWDGRTIGGERVRPGIYLVRLQSDGLNRMRKVVLSK